MPAVTIKMIEADAAGADAGLMARGHTPIADILMPINQSYKILLTDCEATKAEINKLSQEIGQNIKQGQDCEHLKTRVKFLKTYFAERKPDVEFIKARLDQALASLPNLPDKAVPIGQDEIANVEEYRAGTPKTEAMPHWDMVPVQEALELGVKVAGTRYSALKGDVARLHRAIGNFMLDYHAGRGYEEVIPPVIVNRRALEGTGQLPKFADDLFKIDDDRYLIPTAEVSLTNLCADTIYADDVTHRMMALTDCFRAEAGSAGRDTRGLIRQHQFQKVELVTVCGEHNAEAEHQYMLAGAEGILDALGLPYRRMLLCTGDMGFSAQKTYDLEVWMPGQQAYREISSVSNCGDFQARRMNIKYKLNGEMKFANTLNGSGLAVGRTLAAILENYHDNGIVWIPPALVRYTNCRFIPVKDL